MSTPQPPPRRYRAPGTTQPLRTPRRRGAAQPLESSPLLKATLASQRRGQAVDTTVVGAPVPQRTDEFGAPAGVDLTQVLVRPQPRRLPSRVEFDTARQELRQQIGDPVTTGHDDTTLPIVDQSSIDLVPGGASFISLAGDLTIEPGTPGGPPPSLPFGVPFTPPGGTAGAQALGSLPHADVLPPSVLGVQSAPSRLGVQLDDRDLPPNETDASRLNLARAFDAVGSEADGIRAALGADRDPTAHMDDVQLGLRELREMQTQALGRIRGALGVSRDSDDEEPSEADREREEAGVRSRVEAADVLRRTPGLRKLIEAKVFRYDDFMTDGALDPRKLANARRALGDRVESTSRSYALAASARGYTPSGAAYPVEGLNNIVAGNRKIPGTKYVLYQGPQYANG